MIVFVYSLVSGRRTEILMNYFQLLMLLCSDSSELRTPAYLVASLVVSPALHHARLVPDWPVSNSRLRATAVFLRPLAFLQSFGGQRG